MNCERIQTLLEEYCDDELGAAESREVEAHLAGCEACASALESIERETAVYARYDRGFEPSPDMWAGVLARIEPERTRRPGVVDRFRQWFAEAGALLTPGRLVPLAVAACAVVVLGAVAYSVYVSKVTPPVESAAGGGENPVSVPAPTPSTPQVATPTDQRIDHPASAPSGPKVVRVKHTAPRADRGKEDRVAALPLQIAKAEQNYLEAIAVLTKDVERTRGPIDPKLRKPLDDLDRNITTARDAVKKNPGDTEAVLNMLSAYDDKMEVLQTLARFEASRTR